MHRRPRQLLEVGPLLLVHLPLPRWSEQQARERRQEEEGQGEQRPPLPASEQQARHDDAVSLTAALARSLAEFSTTFPLVN